MPAVNRVLDPQPVTTLGDYREIGGGNGLDPARRLDGVGIADEIAAAGLRGRGGAGFPTGVKWRSVAEAAATDGTPPVVVVNGAEGEPGSFKDRALLRTNPYRVLEGALIAATAVRADHVVVALKQSFLSERRRVAYAIAEMTDAGWLGDVEVHVSIGPSDYLYGEETALLEVVEGRQPFPRIAPPYRRGFDGGQDDATGPAGGNESPAPGLVLANNVETYANVPGIVVRGADWFRSLGTDESPGTIVCTVSGDTQRAGVAEFPMGTPVQEIIETVGGGPVEERRFVAAISGVANGILPAELFDTPASYEALQAVGSGLGAAGFIVIDDSTDMISFAHGVSRFLAVESCGQCEPCKSDGLVLAADLELLRRSESGPDVEPRLRERLATITDGARCFLATQHQAVVASILDHYPTAVTGHAQGTLPEAAEVLIAPITDIDDGVAVLDTAQALKQPDWSYGGLDSARWPAAYLGDTPVEVRLSQKPPTRRLPTPPPAAAATEIDTADVGERVVDGDDRPIAIDVGTQLDLAHNELVDALLCTNARGHDGDRAAAVDRFADLLERHLEVTTHVLFPWVRRVGGDEGERVASRAESLESDANDLVESLRATSSDRRLSELADDLHCLIVDEERRVLPLLEQHLDDAELDDIGRAMHEARLERPEQDRTGDALHGSR